MSGYVKTTLALFIVSALCWFVYIVLDPPGFEVVMGCAAVASSVACVAFLAICICRAVNDRISPYRVFAVVCGAVGLATLAYAIYDIQTATGWFGGLLGVMLLLFVLPVIALLLLADFLVWRAKRPERLSSGRSDVKRREKNNE